jgi:drug/metabolite transporter (DMT)-like permease
MQTANFGIKSSGICQILFYSPGKIIWSVRYFCKVKKSWWPVFIIFLLGGIWGSSFILIKRGLEVFQPIQVAGLRQFLAGVVLLPWIFQYSLGTSRKDAEPYAATRLIGNGIPAFLFSYAGTLIPSGLSGIMNAFTPMFTLLLGVAFFKDKFTGNGLIGVILGILGAVILLAPGFIFHSGAQINGLGVIMVTCAAMMYGYNINLIKHKLSHLPAMVKTAYPFFFMGSLYLLVLMMTGIMNHWNTAPEKAWTALGYLTILGVVGSALSMIAFNILIKHTTALVASTNTFIIPVVAVAWGIVENEPITWNMIVGLLFSLAGIYLIINKPAAKA